jgi:hypothetical protein
MSDATEPCDECDCVDGHSLRCTKREPEPPTADRLRNLVHDVTDPETADALHALVDLVFALCARLDMLEARPAPAPAPRVPAAGARRWRKLPHKHEGHDQWTLRDDDNDKAPGVVYAYLSAPGALYWFAYGVGGAGRVKLAEALHDAARLLGLDPATVELPPEAEPAPLCALPFRGGTCHLPQGHRGAHSIARGPVVAGDLAAPAEAAAGAVHDVRVGHVGCVLALVGGTARLADGSDIVARLSLSGSAGLVHVRAPAPADRAEPPPTPEELLRREGFVRGARNVWWRGARNDYPALIVNDANIIVCRTLEDDTHGGKPFPSSDLPAAIAYALGQDAPAAEPPRCTCGSGAHPRRCELHPDAYDRHIAELNRANDEDNAQDEPAPWRYERCKAPRCNGRRNCVGFRVDDAVWSSVVPSELRGRVVCLECFDEMAQEARVAYEVRELFPVTWCADESAQPEPAPEAAAGAVQVGYPSDSEAEAVARAVLDAACRFVDCSWTMLDEREQAAIVRAAHLAMHKRAPADRAEPPPGYAVYCGAELWHWRRVGSSISCECDDRHSASRAEAVAACWDHHDREHDPAQPESVITWRQCGDCNGAGCAECEYGEVATHTQPEHAAEAGGEREALPYLQLETYRQLAEDDDADAADLQEALSVMLALYERGLADARRAGGDEYARISREEDVRLIARLAALLGYNGTPPNESLLESVRLWGEARDEFREQRDTARAELAKLQSEHTSLALHLHDANEAAKADDAEIEKLRADLDARTRERDKWGAKYNFLLETVCVAQDLAVSDAGSDEEIRQSLWAAADKAEAGLDAALAREAGLREALASLIEAHGALAYAEDGDPDCAGFYADLRARKVTLREQVNAAAALLATGAGAGTGETT